MTTRAAAGVRRDAEISGIDEADVGWVFLEPGCVRTHRQRSTVIVAKHVRLRMRLVLGRDVSRRLGRSLRRNEDFLVTAVAIRAAQPDGWGGMHGSAVGLGVAALTACGFLVSLFLALHQYKLGSLI